MVVHATRTPYQAALEAGTAQCQQWADSAKQTLRAAFCTRCLAPILWAENWKTGKKIPIDREPSGEGRIVFVGYERVHFLRFQDPIPGGPETPRFASHFGSCPFAEEFRA